MLVAHRLQAPRQDRAVFAEPPLAEAGRLLADNRQRLAQLPSGLLGRPWADLRRQARRIAVTAAQDYLRRLGEPVPSFEASSLIMAGHQPEHFHPGVWVKNFALHGLAQDHGAAPLNLIVDNDTAKITALRIPALGSGPPEDYPRQVLVPFDRWAGEIPYEERAVRDEELFHSFPARAAEVMSGWDFVPFLPEFWAEVGRRRLSTPLLGEIFSAARRTFERRWGCRNLELPVSLLCRTEPFAWFACHLLADLGRFHAVYNECVREYRRRNHVRSRNHPVPDLAAAGGWLELPFWAWRPDRPRRGRLFARPGREGVDLRVGDEPGPHLPLGPGRDPAEAVAAWMDLERQGFKVRRALTNTLYARLFLADLFVHGIGGGKYDELTDEIVRRFYGFLEPPGYLVLSATLLLPLPGVAADPTECLRLARQLRDLRCNPQRHLADGVRRNAQARDLAAQKRAWIERDPKDGPGRRERFRALKRLTGQLRPYLADQESRVREALDRCDRRLHAQAVLQRRDYAFCLFPEATLREFCSGFLQMSQ